MPEKGSRAVPVLKPKDRWQVVNNEQAFVPNSGRGCKVKKKKGEVTFILCKRVVKRVKK
jgi:hypothetical protein